MGNFKPSWNTPIHKTTLTLVIRKPSLKAIYMDDDWNYVTKNIEAIQKSSPGNATIYEHFVKGEGEEMGIRITHPLFTVSSSLKVILLHLLKFECCSIYKISVTHHTRIRKKT
jgi:hypothetical protein